MSFQRRSFGQLLKRVQSFDQGKLGLPAEFNLLNYAQLKGWGCKVPADKLFQYLKDIGDGQIAAETPDCSVMPYNPKYINIFQMRIHL